MPNEEKPSDRFEPPGERGPIKPFDFNESSYVFVSYPKTTDSDLLRALIRGLLRRGISVWMYDPAPCEFDPEEEKGIRRQSAGGHAEDEALNALKAAKQRLVLVGKRTLQSEFQMMEVQAAIKIGGSVLAKVDDVLYESMPAELQSQFKPDLDVEHQKAEVIARRVRGILDDLGRGVFGSSYAPPGPAAAPYVPAHVPKVFVDPPPPSGPPPEPQKGLSRGVLLLAIFATGAVIAAGGWFWGLPMMTGGTKSAASSAIVTAPSADSPATNATGPRLALVISQRNYSHNIPVVNSADSEGTVIENALTQIGFTVVRKRDQKKEDLKKDLDDFRFQLADAGSTAIGFVYYTGHGIKEPNSENNYLLGVDAQLRNVADLETYGVNLTDLRDNFQTLRTKGIFLVFDACRDTPSFSGTKSATKGLNRLDALPGMLVAYSTDQGDVAEEGRYAPVLARELVVPNRKAETAFVEAKDKVAQESHGGQRPYNDSKLYGLCLTCDAAASTAKPAPQ